MSEDFLSASFTGESPASRIVSDTKRALNKCVLLSNVCQLSLQRGSALGHRADICPRLLAASCSGTRTPVFALSSCAPSALIGSARHQKRGRPS